MHWWFRRSRAPPPAGKEDPPEAPPEGPAGGALPEPRFNAILTSLEAKTILLSTWYVVFGPCFKGDLVVD